MNRKEQTWLVMLYAMNEMGGGGQRRDVLAHINDHGYWKRNDANDAIRASRADRREPVWRNEFSYERVHLVDGGYMQPGGNGIWRITDSGRQRLAALTDMAKRQSAGADVGYTAAFFQKLLAGQELTDDFEQDQLLIDRLSAEDAAEQGPSAPPTGAPLPVSPAEARDRGQLVYPRNPAVSRAALKRARYRCEIDPTHRSFLRRDGQTVYMEPHHLIPMSLTRYFGVSLDREQNICCLCSTCHNQIHYGSKADVRAMLETLFLPRRQDICAMLGRELSLEELYRIYDVL